MLISTRAFGSVLVALLLSSPTVYATAKLSKLKLGDVSGSFEVQKVIVAGNKVGIIHKNLVLSEAPSTNLDVSLNFNSLTNYYKKLESNDQSFLLFAARTSEMDLDLSQQTKAKLGITDISDLDKVLSVDIENKAKEFVRDNDDEVEVKVLPASSLLLVTYTTNNNGLKNVTQATDLRTGTKFELEITARGKDYKECREQSSPGDFKVKNLMNGKETTISVYGTEHIRDCDNYVQSVYQYESSVFFVIQNGSDSYMASPFVVSVNLDILK